MSRPSFPPRGSRAPVARPLPVLLVHLAVGLLALSPCLALPAAGQAAPGTLAGMVFDEVSGEPLPGVSVILTDSTGFTPVTTVVTGAQGRFSLPVTPGRYWLIATRTGFAASPPREVVWEAPGGRLDGVLLNIRSMDPGALAVRAEADAARQNAQVLGRVVDRSTGEIVVGAEVVLAGTGLRTLTDQNGMFVFPDVPPGLEILRVQHLAYGEHERELVVEAGTTYRVDGRLAPEAVELEGLEVTVASRSWFRQMDELRLRMRSALGGSYVMADDLERRGYPPLAETLREVPGVNVRRNGFQWQITIPRCASTANSQEPVIYMDGMKVYSPGSGQTMDILQMVSTMDVEAVEVYKGAASLPAEFSGTDAACGAVIIWTKRGG